MSGNSQGSDHVLVFISSELQDIAEKKKFLETLITDGDGETIFRLSLKPLFYLLLTKCDLCLIPGQDKHRSLLRVGFF